MRNLERRVRALEKKREEDGNLLVVRVNFWGGFTPEEETLFAADDERQIREAEERLKKTGTRDGLTYVLLLKMTTERLAELKRENAGGGDGGGLTERGYKKKATGIL